MLEYILIAGVTFLASLLSFFSGFGLGTILMPVIAIFLPLPIAIALTACTHLVHNFLKTVFFWKAIDWKIAAQFGIAAILAAIPGALLLKKLSSVTPIWKWEFLGMNGQISLLHISIGLLLISFATLEMTSNRRFKGKSLILGGVLSGFFGGFSGNQGAFRSVFLIHSNLDKRAFIGTSAVISVVVDCIRLIIYGFSFYALFQTVNISLLSLVISGAIFGVFFGMAFLKKVTLIHIQKAIRLLLYLLGFLLVIGII